MRILITGGAGFIGSHITDALLEHGNTVTIIDNLSTGNLENVSDSANLIQEDITDFIAIKKIFESANPEIVFHCAAQIDVRQSVADPLGDARTNILASLNLIELAKQYKVRKFIFSSTGGAIYGDTDIRPTPENHTESPLSPYGIAKLAVDKYLHYYKKIHGLSYISLRYGNVYGPRQNPHGEAGVIAIFVNKMLAGENPVINGNGLQTRDYVYIEDVVAANLAALNGQQAKSGIYNVGTGVETNVNQLFNEINSRLGGTFREEHGPEKPGEQQTSCLACGKIKSNFGWKPATDITTGIGKTCDWFKDRKNPLQK